MVYRDLNWVGEDDLLVEFKTTEFKGKDYGYKPKDLKIIRDFIKSIPYSPLILSLLREEEKDQALLDVTKRYTVKNTIKKLQE